LKVSIYNQNIFSNNNPAGLFTPPVRNILFLYYVILMLSAQKTLLGLTFILNIASWSCSGYVYKNSVFHTIFLTGILQEILTNSHRESPIKTQE